MKSTGSRGRVGGCLVLAGGFGVESEPTFCILSLTSSPALDHAGDDGRCIHLRVAPTPLRRETDGKVPPRKDEGHLHHAHPPAPTPGGPFTFAFLPGSSSHRYKPCRAVCEDCPPVTERSGQASQGSEQGGPGATPAAARLGAHAALSFSRSLSHGFHLKLCKASGGFAGWCGSGPEGKVKDIKSWGEI